MKKNYDFYISEINPPEKLLHERRNIFIYVRDFFKLLNFIFMKKDVIFTKYGTIERCFNNWFMVYDFIPYSPYKYLLCRIHNKSMDVLISILGCNIYNAGLLNS